jgi:hypothetical protein
MLSMNIRLQNIGVAVQQVMLSQTNIILFTEDIWV